MSSYFSTPDSYEKVYLSFDPMHRLMKERNITDLELARKVGVKVDVIRNTYKYQDTVTLSVVQRICEALDCGPGDLVTAGKVEQKKKPRTPKRPGTDWESKGQYSVRQRGGRAGPSRCVYVQPPHPPRPAMPDGQWNPNQPTLLIGRSIPRLAC